MVMVAGWSSGTLISVNVHDVRQCGFCIGILKNKSLLIGHFHEMHIAVSSVSGHNEPCLRYHVWQQIY
jgi:hypothetical protein